MVAADRLTTMGSHVASIPLLLVFITACCCRLIIRSESLDFQPDIGHDDRKPLNLTAYIDSGRIEDGQKAAKVEPLLSDVVSYSGYFSVDSIGSKNLFFWYFPAEESPETAPVILWLQGGPGVTSMFGLLAENGPYELQDDLSLKMRDQRWTKKHHVIYFDQPVTVGFSYCKDGCLVKSEAEVGADMYSALAQFFTLFPHLSDHEFFIFGESFGGIYVPVIAYAVHTNNCETDRKKINLRGIAIGDGVVDWTSPDDTWLEEHGLEAQAFEGPWSVYNYLKDGGEDSQQLLATVGTFFQTPSIKAILHVGNESFQDISQDVLLNEQYPVSSTVEILLEHYRVLYYTGQLDYLINYPQTENFAYNLKWSGSEEFLNSKRQKWIVSNDRGKSLAGYVKSGGNMSLVLVRNAGHMVPHDQPLWAHELASRFVRNNLTTL